MDVVPSPIPGMMPSWRSTLLRHQLLPAVAVTTGFASGAATSAAPVEVTGQVDGADLVLPSGVRIRRKRIGGLTVTQSELAQAIRGVQLLPLQHQLVIARAGIAIELLPLAHLEQVAGTSDPVLGATAVVQDTTGTWLPTRIRVAVRSPLAGANGANTIAEVAQHEIGHAIAVLGSQDRSEETAIKYAQRY